MKITWIALSLVASTAVLASIGCGDDTSGSGGSGATTSSSSSSGSGTGGMAGSGGMGTGGMATGGTGGMGTGGMGTGGMAAYADCGACTNDVSGAYGKECKAQETACKANADCLGLYTWAYNNTTTDKDGACALLAYVMTNNVPQAAVDLYKALDNCVTCTTCKDLCTPGSTDYCANIANNGSMCP